MLRVAEKRHVDREDIMAAYNDEGRKCINFTVHYFVMFVLTILQIKIFAHCYTIA